MEQTKQNKRTCRWRPDKGRHAVEEHDRAQELRDVLLPEILEKHDRLYRIRGP